ncbi:DUF6894 family protein (plasmid) [Microvirga sp. RSM25]|uniref:DUF6894 family protein n=1 Tax=Microvirga sp. RSM25 TaxID=3273802 RepID=UPI00384DB686
MRCFFHLVSTHDQILDDTGLEVMDLDAMHQQIARAIHEHRQDDHHNEEDWRDWQLDVVDESGNLLVSMPLGMPLA